MMQHSSDYPDDRLLKEHEAGHILRRAAELDETHVMVGDLRRAAVEAGIGAAAFEAAVAEASSRTVRQAPPSSLPKAGVLLILAAALVAAALNWVAPVEAPEAAEAIAAEKPAGYVVEVIDVPFTGK